MPRAGNEIVVILWRDIPAQVNAQSGRARQQVPLSSKFQRAIDRAKRKAGIDTAHEDVAQWRRESRPCAGDPLQDATAEAQRIERAFGRERLGRLAYAGGWERDAEANHISAAELAALEELDDNDDADAADAATEETNP